MRLTAVRHPPLLLVVVYLNTYLHNTTVVITQHKRSYYVYDLTRAQLHVRYLNSVQ